MASKRALHFVFKVGNRTETASFFRQILGMKVIYNIYLILQFSDKHFRMYICIMMSPVPYWDKHYPTLCYNVSISYNNLNVIKWFKGNTVVIKLENLYYLSSIHVHVQSKRVETELSIPGYWWILWKTKEYILSYKPSHVYQIVKMY